MTATREDLIRRLMAAKVHAARTFNRLAIDHWDQAEQRRLRAKARQYLDDARMDRERMQ